VRQDMATEVVGHAGETTDLNGRQGECVNLLLFPCILFFIDRPIRLQWGSVEKKNQTQFGFLC